LYLAAPFNESKDPPIVEIEWIIPVKTLAAFWFEAKICKKGTRKLDLKPTIPVNISISPAVVLLNEMPTA
jgi:hypothetical protein